jgi:hypothetical protein
MNKEMHGIYFSVAIRILKGQHRQNEEGRGHQMKSRNLICLEIRLFGVWIVVNYLFMLIFLSP